MELDLNDKIQIDLISSGYNHHLRIIGPSKNAHAVVGDVIDMIEQGIKIKINNPEVYDGVQDLVLLLNQLSQTDINIPPLPNAVTFFTKKEYDKQQQLIDSVLNQSGPKNKLSLDPVISRTEETSSIERLIADLDNYPEEMQKTLINKIMKKTGGLLPINNNNQSKYNKNRLIMTEDIKKIQELSKMKQRDIEFKMKKNSGMLDIKANTLLSMVPENSGEDFIIDDDDF